MRKIALFSILALLICSWFLFRDTEIVQASLSKINSKFDNITKQREVRFEGLSILDESDFAALVPFDRSIAWWRLNRNEVIKSVTKHPLIKSAEIRDCPDSRIGCAVIHIEERIPTLISLSSASRDGSAVSNEQSDAAWIVAQDGSFITTLVPTPKLDTFTDVRLAGKRFSNLPLVTGIESVGGDAQVVSARARYVAESLPILVENFGSGIRSASLSQQGELTVVFTKLKFPVTFNQDEQDSRAALIDQVARLRALLANLGVDSERVASIDLAFNRIGVVKFKE